jgi:hypothetical protein
VQIEKFLNHGRFAEFVLGGSMTLYGLKDLLRQVFAECGRLGIGGAVVDVAGVSGTLTASDRAELVGSLSDELPRGIAVAMVLNDDQFLPTRLGELMAQNRGFRTREFRQREEAVAWLAAALAPPPPEVL